VLCEACWGVNVWIGAPQLLEGPLVEYCLCGIGRFWRRSKSVWGVYCFLLLQNFEDGFSWAFAGFMGLIPTLIEELASLLNWWNLLWCIGGDFNVTCFPSERLGEARFSSVMMEFPNFISWIFPL